MAFGLEFYVVAAFIVVLTGISKAGFGAGVEMMAVPVMALFIAPQTAAGIMLPILMAIDLANIWRYRADWERRIVAMLIPAALVGIGIGTASFHILSADWMKLGLGGLSLLFVIQRCFFPVNDVQAKRPHRSLTIVLGAVAGFTSFVAHAGGPPMKMVLLSHRLSNRQFVGTNSYVFAVINFLKCFPYFFLGQLSVENLSISVSLLPFVCIGVPLGFWLNGVVSQIWFNRIVILALVVAGLKLIWDGSAVFL